MTTTTFYLRLAEHVMVNGDTEVAYIPLVKLTPANSNTDYWTYDGRYTYIHYTHTRVLADCYIRVFYWCASNQAGCYIRVFGDVCTAGFLNLKNCTVYLLQH